MARRTNVAREDEEVVVGQAAVVLGVEQGLNIDTIALGVLLEHIKGRVEIEDLLLVQDGDLLHAVTVEDRHGGRESDNKKNEVGVSQY